MLVSRLLVTDRPDEIIEIFSVEIRSLCQAIICCGRMYVRQTEAPQRARATFSKLLVELSPCVIRYRVCDVSVPS